MASAKHQVWETKKKTLERNFALTWVSNPEPPDYESDTNGLPSRATETGKN